MSAFARLAGVARRARSVLTHNPPVYSQLQPLHAGRILGSNVAPPPTPVPVGKSSDSFLDGASASYLEELEKQYAENPESVDKTWANYLKLLDSGASPSSVAGAFGEFKEGGALTSPAISATGELSHDTIQKSMRLLLLIRAYQVNGHHMADLDPLGLDERHVPADLDPGLYGFTEDDLDKEFFVGTWRMKGFLSEDQPVQTLRQVLDRLRRTYCGSVGYEYMHMSDREKCNWLRDKIETREARGYSKRRKTLILDRLAWSDMFEGFLSNKYTAAKRFGLEGAESLIPGMKAMIDRSAELGVDTIVMGMPHRGRLNVLANVVRKPLPQIFSEFSGGMAPEKDGLYSGSGDVKYHLGTSYDRPTLSGNKIHLSLVANPSHLEAVNTVVVGKVRAKQYYNNDEDRSRTMSVLLHGDGAFSGQGIVYETLDMSNLPEYTVGGTIHLVVNNQVAFTTDPRFSRSSPYCTDVARTVDAPIFHVNGDDPEAVTHVCELAAEWRHRFKSDVVVDIVCYRRFGHNEIDEPMFTQPLMYRKIRNHRSTHQMYADKLVKSGTFSPEEVKAIQDRVSATLNEEFENSKDYVPQPRDWLASHWDGFKSPNQMSKIRDTGVSVELLNKVSSSAFTIPEGFHAHKAVKRVYDQRLKSVQTGEGIDWATAEALAFGTLLHEGFHVRLSGQDVERGTFSHRHCILHDQKTGQRHCILDHLFEGQHPQLFTVSNSSLSEFGVLGFELGYSMENPNALVIWEAQFGDFANSAQIIIDQFISSGEAKWLRQSGLVLLLPHGYDGQGPEHSSARLERYLQMVDEDPYAMPEMSHTARMQVQSINMQVCNISTPANYFHALRRQIHRDFRKPLIVMSPKNLLRHPQARSPMSYFDDVEEPGEVQGPRFRRLIMDESSTSRDLNPTPEPSFKRVVFCSGKVYYDLAAEREKEGKEREVAICRVEQIAPFPFDLVERELKRYPDAEVVWCQEEHMNMGAYSHVLPRFLTVLKSLGRPYGFDAVRYAGRAPSASTATGFGNVHAMEQAQLVTDAIH